MVYGAEPLLVDRSGARAIDFDAGLRRAQTEQAIAGYDATVAEYRQAVLAGFRRSRTTRGVRILDKRRKSRKKRLRASRESVVLTTTSTRPHR